MLWLVVYVLAFMSLGLVVCIIVWLLFIKREFFDPRIYVLYGMLHWLLLGQILTLLGYEFYEVKPVFNELTHIKASFAIFFSIISFLLGYQCLAISQFIKQQCCSAAIYGVRPKKIAIIASLMGVSGLTAQYFFQKNLFLIREFLFTPLILTMTGISGSVLAAYVFTVRRKSLTGIRGKVLQLVLATVVLFAIIGSNINWIFPLFALFYWQVISQTSPRKNHLCTKLSRG